MGGEFDTGGHDDLASRPTDAPGCGCRGERAPDDEDTPWGRLSELQGFHAEDRIVYCATHAAAFRLADYVALAWKEAELGLPVFGRHHDDVYALLKEIGR